MRRGCGVSLIVVLSLGATTHADPPVPKSTCLTAHEEGQKLRAEGKLIAAREKMLLCAAETCPALIKVDCVKWVPELDRDLPTVIVRAREGDADVLDVRVWIDGEKKLEKLDGKPLVLDPGVHKIKYERDNAAAIEQDVIIRAGEKNRALVVTFPGHEAPVEAPKPSTVRLAAPWVVGGLGVIALGSFAYFGITARNKLSTLEETCAPRCDPGERDAVHRKLVIADVSLVVSLVSFGVAGYLFVTQPKSPTSPTTLLTVRPLAGGAFASLVATF